MDPASQYGDIKSHYIVLPPVLHGGLYNRTQALNMHRGFVLDQCLMDNVTLQLSSFYVDWNNGTFGITQRDGNIDCRSDFAIKLTMLVEADDRTGYLCMVKRAIDGKER